jgi:hypothetical protein
MNALDGAYKSTVQMTETIKRKWLAQFQELFARTLRAARSGTPFDRLLREPL